jgi:hypothetical protein
VGGYELYKFPYRYNLLMGTTANLLFMAAHLYRRNELKYTVPGGGITDQAKAAEYDAAGERLWQQYKEWCAWKKKSLNVHQGWGQI